MKPNECLGGANPGLAGSGLVVGITGLPCSGKSLAAQLLADPATVGTPFTTLNADRICHEMLDNPEVAARVGEKFGPEVLREDGTADRKKLGEVVFPDLEKLVWLETLLHPLIGERIVLLLADPARLAPVALEAALLFGSGLEELCDLILVIVSPAGLRQTRAAERGWSPELAELREKRIAGFLEGDARAKAGDKVRTVHNDGSDVELARRLREALDGVGRLVLRNERNFR